VGGQTYPWGHPLVLSPLIASFFIGAFFILWENKYAFEPIFPPSLVIQRDVATSYCIMTLQISAQIAVRCTLVVEMLELKADSEAR